MNELSQIEIEEVSGGNLLKWSGYLEAARQFCKGFVEGVKEGYNA